MSAQKYFVLYGSAMNAESPDAASQQIAALMRSDKPIRLRVQDEAFEHIGVYMVDHLGQAINQSKF